MDYSLVHIVFTLLMFASFIGIVAWAWSGKQKRRFEAAARAPLEEDESVAGERKHG